MDKLILNNQIVSMRQDARKARVHTINKLVRESKKLKSKNGSEEQKKKNLRKAERFVQEIFILKKFKHDEISKFALCNTRNPDEILADPTESQRDKALARLSRHPSVSASVKQFRTKFPTWANTLPQLLLQLGTKKKKAKQKQRKHESGQEKDKKATTSAGEESLKNNAAAVTDDSDYSSGANDTVISETKENTLMCSDDKVQTLISVDQKTVKRKTKRKNDTLKPSNDVDDKCITEPQKKCVAEVKRFSELLEEYSNDKSRDCNDDEEENIDSTSIPDEAVVDPFFVYEDGETEYRTSVKVIPTDSKRTDTYSREKRQQQAMWNTSNRGSNWSEKKINFQEKKRDNFKSFQCKPSVHEKNLKGNRRKDSSVIMEKQKNIHQKQSFMEGDDAQVHPSWEAKKRLKEQQSAVFAFQGKKIKFDD